MPTIYVLWRNKEKLSQNYHQIPTLTSPTRHITHMQWTYKNYTPNMKKNDLQFVCFFFFYFNISIFFRLIFQNRTPLWRPFWKIYKNTVLVQKFRILYPTLFSPKFCFLSNHFLKVLYGMTNSVDSDQIAPLEQSDLGLHGLHMLFCQKL